MGNKCFLTRPVSAECQVIVMFLVMLQRITSQMKHKKKKKKKKRDGLLEKDIIPLLINQQFHSFLETKQNNVHFHVVISTHHFKINMKKAYILNAFPLRRRKAKTFKTPKFRGPCQGRVMPAFLHSVCGCAEGKGAEAGSWARSPGTCWGGSGVD